MPSVRNIQASEDKYCSACGAPFGAVQDEQPSGAEPSSGKPRAATNRRILLGTAGALVLMVAVAALFAPEEDEPTVAPAPAPTISPPTAICPSPAEAAYLDELDGHMRSFGAQMGMLGDRWAEAADTPLLIFDDMWVMGRETDLEVLRLQTDRMIDLSPPPSARKLDALVETTMGRADDALALMSEGITTPDMDLLVEGSNLMNSVSDRARWIRVDMGVEVFCAN